MVIDVEKEMSRSEKYKKMEQEFAARCEVEGRVYVKNGSRDKWGMERQNKGGRPPQDFADKLQTRGKAHHKRPGTMQAKMEFTAPKLIAMGREVRKEIELFWQQLGKGDSERYRSAEDEQNLDKHLKRLWKGWNPRHIRQIATVEEQKRLADVCKKLHLGKMTNAREMNPKGSR